MTNHDRTTQEQRVLASLTLTLLEDRQGDEPIKLPSIEQLAAFYEGRLNDTERSEVLGALAHRPEVYAQWLVLVEYFECLDADTVTAPIKLKFLQRVKSNIATFIQVVRNPGGGTSLVTKLAWFRASAVFFKVPRYAASAGFACLSITLMVLLFWQQAPTIDALYAVYGPSIKPMLVTLPSRGLVPMRQEPSPELLLFSDGVAHGIVALKAERLAAKPAWYRQHYDLALTKQALGEPLSQYYYDLGRWAVITHSQCAQAEQGDNGNLAGKLELGLDRGLDDDLDSELSIDSNKANMTQFLPQSKAALEALLKAFSGLAPNINPFIAITAQATYLGNKPADMCALSRALFSQSL